MKFRELRCLWVAGCLMGALMLRPVYLRAAEKKEIFTLERSIAEALDRNWSIKAVLEEKDQANQAVKQARAGFLPKVDMSYGYTRLSEPVTFRSTLPGGLDIAVSTQDNYRWKGTVSQPVFTGFALTSAYELAKLGIDQSEMRIQQRKLDLALEVKARYFGILEADKALDVARKAVTSLASHVGVAESFYKVGMIPVNDLLKSRVQLANARQDLVKARNAARLARCAFNTLLSRPVDAPVEVKDILRYRPEGRDLRSFMAEALDRRPEIKLIDVHLLQADQRIRMARSRNYPEVAFTCDYIKEGNHPDVSGSRFHDAGRWQAMAVLSWNIWEWEKTHYSVLEQESRRRQFVKTRKAVEDTIRLEVKQAFLDLETAARNIPTTRKAVEQGEENLRVSEERYKAQVSTSTEVLDAQTLLTEARTNYHHALYDYNLALARLKRAIGTY